MKLVLKKHQRYFVITQKYVTAYYLAKKTAGKITFGKKLFVGTQYNYYLQLIMQRRNEITF